MTRRTDYAEREGDRSVIDSITRDLIAEGIEPKEANHRARRSMGRVDRRAREEGRR